MNKKWIKIISSCLIIGTIGTGGYFAYTKYASSKTAKAGNNYITSKVTKTNLQVNVQGTGTVFASITKDVVSNNSGEIKELSVKEGDSVKKGDKLFQVYNNELEQQVTNADINLQKQNLQLQSARDESDTQMQNLNIQQAQQQLNSAVAKRNSMNVTSPVSGVIVSKANNNGDNIQSGRTVLQVVDMNSLKIRVEVDELDISKMKVGQKAEIKFEAIENKTYEGVVETIAQLGQTSNNVTTYDVVVSIKDMSGIKIGMNGSVNISVASKEDALVVPVEALVEQNGNKYVRVAETDNTKETPTKEKTSKETNKEAIKKEAIKKEAIKNKEDAIKRKSKTNDIKGKVNYGQGNLVKVETGLENVMYVEITSGLTEGQEILIQLPSTSGKDSYMKKDLGGMKGKKMPIKK